MDTSEIRAALAEKATRHGALKDFCKKNDLSYSTVWRFAKGMTDKIDHSLGIKISELLNNELQEVGGDDNA